MRCRPIHGPRVSIVFHPNQGPMLFVTTGNVNPQPDCRCQDLYILPSARKLNNVHNLQQECRSGRIVGCANEREPARTASVSRSLDSSPFAVGYQACREPDIRVYRCRDDLIEARYEVRRGNIE